MRESLVPLLRCPATGQPLELTVTRSEGPEIMEGSLQAPDGRTYPIVRGVPRMFLQPPDDTIERTVEHFGWQWNQFNYLLPAALEREQYLDWVRPLTEADFADRRILDAGCGMGRWPETLARFGAREIVGVDLGSAVEAAFERLRGYPHLHVVQADILHMPFATGADAPFDLAYSLGVIHHMPDAAEGFRAYSRHVRPGGTVHAWVYGAENNGWITRFVDPVRTRVTSHLPPPVLHEMSRLLTIPVHGASRFVHRAGLRNTFAYGPYLDWLGRFPFHHTHHIVHDHLTPSLASYHTRDEVEDWAASVNLQDVHITARNNNSWRLVGRMPGA
jgi:SAM-dependent methyltransferase